MTSHPAAADFLPIPSSFYSSVDERAHARKPGPPSTMPWPVEIPLLHALRQLVSWRSRRHSLCGQLRCLASHKLPWPPAPGESGTPPGEWDGGPYHCQLARHQRCRHRVEASTDLCAAKARSWTVSANRGCPKRRNGDGLLGWRACVDARRSSPSLAIRSGLAAVGCAGHFGVRLTWAPQSGAAPFAWKLESAATYVPRRGEGGAGRWGGRRPRASRGV